MVIRRILSSCWETNPVFCGFVDCWFEFCLRQGGCDILTCWFEVLISRSVHGTGIPRKLSWVVSGLTLCCRGAWFVSWSQLFWPAVYSGRCQGIVLNWTAAPFPSYWFQLTFQWPNWYLDFLFEFYVYGSVHRWSILIIVQRDATQSSLFIILQVHVSSVNHTHHQAYTKV